MESLLYAISAFFLGSLHAIEPGHGKTVVAAYLVGTRGTVRDAIALGAIVTFTHTSIVVTLGILSVVAAAYLMPETVEGFFGMVSGLLIMLVGGWMIYTRILQKGDPHQSHDHPHREESPTHYQRLSLLGLLTLGISGGIVPCPAAIAILLAAVGIGNIVGGVSLVVVFSLGLAAVLIAIGIVIVKAQALAGKYVLANSTFVRWIGTLSALVVTSLGIFITTRAIIALSA